MLNKRGFAKRIFTIFTIGIILLAFGVFAQNEQNFDEKSLEKTKTYVEEFANKRGIEKEMINNISTIDFNDLPEEVDIENFNDANLEIYEVNYSENNQERQLYVVTFSTTNLKNNADLIADKEKRQLLHFGLSEEVSGSTFLNTATGVPGSLEVGYVMMRFGSITGISTNIEVLEETDEELDILIYKNGEVLRFGNTFYSDSIGIKKDYDVQSMNVLNFQPGDVISVLASSDGVNYRNVITTLEITTLE